MEPKNPTEDYGDLPGGDEHTEAEEASYENYKNVVVTNPEPQTQELPF